MNPLIQLKKPAPLLIALALLGFALSPTAQAVVPPPDGGYRNFNTAEGQKALFSLTTGQWNTALGAFTLWKNTDGSFNTAVGTAALLFNIGNQNAGEGIENTAVGAAALLLNTTGSENTAVGVDALSNNTEGHFNTATGAFALFSNTTGQRNTATGDGALLNNTTGSFNTAIGDGALFNNTTGGFNTAIGRVALLSNTTATGNTATGAQALINNTTGALNTASGVQALFNNTIGGGNTGNGQGSLFSNTTGDDNTAVGGDALRGNTTGSFNTAFGNHTLENNTSGSFNIALRGGFNLTTGNFNIDIGSDGVAGESGTIRIGDGCCQSRAFIAGIFGTAVSGSTVVVDANGQLGVALSSTRFKNEIKPLKQASEVIYGLKPVSFRYKPQIEPTRPLNFGLIAEEVEKISADLVSRDKEGKPYTVRYDAVNAMLLNEFLKEHYKNEKQEATIACLQRQLEALTAEVKKTSAQIGMGKVAANIALNNH